MKASEIYQDYDKRVQDYMQNVIDCIKQDYKVIPSSWRITIDLIAMNFSILIQAEKDIKEKGIFYKDEFERMTKNPNLMVFNQAQNQIIKYLSTFGLTPISKTRLKNFNSDQINIDSLIND
jgi:P27 family predicted phage terminase small subunit